MNHHLSQTSVAITAIVVVALIIVVGSTAVNAFLMMTAIPAYAAPAKEKVIERSQIEGGFAEWTDISVEVPGVGTVVYADLNVAESDGGTTDIFVELITEEGNSLQGFTTIDQNVFDTDKKLTSATLSPVTMEVVTFDEFGNVIGTAEITIQATWEGTGDLGTRKSIEHGRSDDFSFKSKSLVLVREASAEGSINNANLGTSDLAFLFAIETVEVTVSKNIIT
jgi:hypothetical protein